MAQPSRTALIILALLVILSMEFRLYYAFQTPHFSTDAAYGNLQTIEYILDTGKPTSLDGAPANIFHPPLFQYMVAFFALILPLNVAAKVLPSILISSLIIVGFFISYIISKNESAALFSAFLLAFTPILYQAVATNSVSTYTLVIPLMFLLFYSFMRISEQRYLYVYLGTMILLPLVHPISVIVVLIFLIYLILLRMERMGALQEEKEVIIFTFLYITWTTFVFYKNALLLYGPKIIWQNVPSTILDNYFASTTVLDAILPIGLLPFLFGLIVIYKCLFVEKDANLYLLFSIVIACSLLLWLRLIRLELGLLVIAIVLCLLFAKAYAMFLHYIETTHFEGYYKLFVLLFFLVVAITNVLPTLGFARQNIERTITPDQVHALEWMRVYLDDDAVVLAPLEEGNYVSAIAKKHVVGRSDYLLIDDVDQVVEDINRIYSTSYETEALGLLQKYSVDVIYISPSTKKRYGIESPAYLSNKNCFRQLLDYESDVYEVLCRIQEAPRR